jgi:hypothetical protein
MSPSWNPNEQGMKRSAIAAGWTLAALRGTLMLVVQAAISAGLWWWISGAIGFTATIRKVVLVLIIAGAAVRWVIGLVASGNEAVHMVHDVGEER